MLDSQSSTPPPRRPGLDVRTVAGMLSDVRCSAGCFLFGFAVLGISLLVFLVLLLVVLSFPFSAAGCSIARAAAFGALFGAYRRCL